MPTLSPVQCRWPGCQKAATNRVYAMCDGHRRRIMDRADITADEARALTDAQCALLEEWWPHRAEPGSFWRVVNGPPPASPLARLLGVPEEEVQGAVTGLLRAARSAAGGVFGAEWTLPEVMTGLGKVDSKITSLELSVATSQKALGGLKGQVTKLNKDWSKATGDDPADPAVVRALLDRLCALLGAAPETPASGMVALLAREKGLGQDAEDRILDELEGALGMELDTIQCAVNVIAELMAGASKIPGEGSFAARLGQYVKSYEARGEKIGKLENIVKGLREENHGYVELCRILDEKAVSSERCDLSSADLLSRYTDKAREVEAMQSAGYPTGSPTQRVMYKWALMEERYATLEAGHGVKVEKYRKDRDAWEAEKAKMEAENAKLLRDLEGLQEEYAVIKEDYGKLFSDFGALRTELATLQEAHERLQEENGDLFADLGLADIENQKLREAPVPNAPEHYLRLVLTSGAELRGRFRFVDGAAPRFEGHNGAMVFASSVQYAVPSREAPEPVVGVMALVPGCETPQTVMGVTADGKILLSNGSWITRERWDSLDWDW